MSVPASEPDDQQERSLSATCESTLQLVIDENRLLRRRLQAQLAQLNFVTSTVDEGLVTYDPAGKILLDTPSAQKIFLRDNLVGMELGQLLEVEPSDLEKLFPESPAVHESGPDCKVAGLACRGEFMNFSAVRKNGESFTIEISTKRFIEAEDDCYIALLRDQTTRHLLEARLLQAQKMESIGQLAAGIAHEINTPIQFVGDNLQFLNGSFQDFLGLVTSLSPLIEGLSDQAGSSALKQHFQDELERLDLPFLCQEVPNAVQQSMDGIERVASIVRAMKEFSKPPSERKTSVDINRVIKNTLSVAQNHYRDFVTVITFLDANLSSIPCFESQMNQVFLNLLTNAIDAIAEKRALHDGRIEILTASKGDHVEISFADNGTGVPKEIRDRIFEPFFTTKEVGKGSGQGLAFVYDAIVNKHHGSIRLVSPSVGGAKFVIQLPVSTSSSVQRNEYATAAD